MCFVFQARIARDLIELRNKSVFFFFMCNALFILIVFLLQLNKGALYVVWPIRGALNVTLPSDEERDGVSLLYSHASQLE